MIESNKARWALIIFVALVALFYFAPNVVKTSEDSLLPNKKIVYGLDIQGGLHLVMGVDVEGVIEEKARRMAGNLKEDAKTQGLAVTSSQIPSDHKTWVQVQLGPGTSAEEFNQYIEDFYGTTLQVIGGEGKDITLRFYDARIQEYKKQVIDQAIEVIRNRIDEFGVSEPVIAAQGESRILVQLPGIEDSARAKELINRTARLSFRPLSKEVSQEKLAQMIAQVEKKNGYSLSDEGLAYSEYLERLNEDLRGQLPENTRLVFQEHPNAETLEAGKIPYLLETNHDLGGNELEDVSVRPGQYGKPEVIFRLTVDGRRKFAQMTEENVGNQVAIVLDGVVQSAPNIEEKINSATARITLGSQDYQSAMSEAKFIATALRAGALPAALTQLEERTVGPTLGADAIAKGKVAGLVGGLLVILFMLFYYRRLGVFANLALAFNILLILAILTSLGATLTLPGVAGIILTVGMAVDANVIIFERIKEELAKGAGIKSAIANGFGHAFSAIMDANITTAVVCVVLMYYGTGPVRGFAVTLLCGVITSMFTSIFFSRTLMDFVVHKFQLKKLA